jgi:hypothetical protein
MRRRELRVVATERVVGVVAMTEDGARFEGAAVQVFARLRTELGEDEVARRLLDEGWSNGYLYLAP